MSRLDEILHRAQRERRRMERIVNTGIGSSSEPESLFYTRFHREDAIAFRDIFIDYRAYYKENIESAAHTLFDQLDRQCEYMESSKINPSEILLFSVRYILDIVEDDIWGEHFDETDTAGVIVQVLQKHLIGCYQSIQYILGGWEWPTLQYLLLRACGRCNDPDIIQKALDCAAKAIDRLVSQGEITVLQGYVDMLSLSQNDDFLPELAKLFTLEQTRNNSTAENYLMEKIENDPYLQTKRQQVFGLLKKENISNKLKDDINFKEKPSRRPSYNPLDDPELSYEQKAEYLNSFDLTMDAGKFMADTERCFDKYLRCDICRKLCEDFDLLPEGLWPKALIRLGTTGAGSNDPDECWDLALPLLERLYDQCYDNSSIEVPILIALYEFRNIYEEELFEGMDKVELDADKDRAVMAYFRWRKQPLLSEYYFSHVETMLNNNPSKDDRLQYLKNMYQLGKGFNGSNKNLGSKGNTPDVPIVTNILRIVDNVFASIGFEKDTYDILVRLLELVESSCSDEKKTYQGQKNRIDIPPILDEPYKLVPRDGMHTRLLKRMEELYRKIDGIALPV